MRGASSAICRSRGLSSAGKRSGKPAADAHRHQPRRRFTHCKCRHHRGCVERIDLRNRLAGIRIRSRGRVQHGAIFRSGVWRFESERHLDSGQRRAGFRLRGHGLRLGERLGHLHRASPRSVAECHHGDGHQPGRSNKICFGYCCADEWAGHRADSSVQRDGRGGAKHRIRRKRRQFCRRQRQLGVGDFYPGRAARHYLRFHCGMHHGDHSHRCAISRHVDDPNCESGPA